MELYIGGFAQGKLEYVLAHVADDNKYMIIDCANDGYMEKIKEADTFNEKILINHMHIWVKDLLKKGKEPYCEILSFAQKHTEAIFICDEIGSGIIPMEKEDRIWREETGRIVVDLAKKAEKVERILCGLGQRLK